MSGLTQVGPGVALAVLLVGAAIIGLSEIAGKRARMEPKAPDRPPLPPTAWGSGGPERPSEPPYDDRDLRGEVDALRSRMARLEAATWRLEQERRP